MIYGSVEGWIGYQTCRISDLSARSYTEYKIRSDLAENPAIRKKIHNFNLLNFVHIFFKSILQSINQNGVGKKRLVTPEQLVIMSLALMIASYIQGIMPLLIIYFLVYSTLSERTHTDGSPVHH